MTFTIWEMESPVISWIFTVPEIPEALFPQILKDLMTGMGNAKRYFETYDGDGEHIYMTGTSAGASLCVYLAAMLKSPEVAKAFQVVPNDLKIRALGLASGMYYTTKPDSIGIFLPSYIYGKHWKKSSFYPYINPENKEIIRNLPPSFLVTAYGDTLRNYSRQYAKAIIRRWWNFFLNTDEMPGNLTGVRIRIILPAQGCNRYIQLRTQFS